MGLSKMLMKTVKSKTKVMMVAATFEKWEEKPAEAIPEFVKDMIAQVKKDHPLYRYVKSGFDYTYNGNIDFKFRFELKEFKSRLSFKR